MLGRTHHAILLHLLDQAGFQDRRNVEVRNLSHGEQRQLEIVLGLASDPKILLLDEPAAGLSLAELDRLGELIASIGRLGTTVVIVEHHLELVANICSSVTVLERGAVLASGTPAEVFSHKEVIAAYMGSQAVAS